MRKPRDIEPVATERRRITKESEPNYHTTKLFSGNLLAIEVRKRQIVMGKPLYLGLIMLELNKILKYEFQYNYLKTKNGGKEKLCFIVYIKTDDIYKEISENLETRFDTSSLELDRPFAKRKK